MEPKDSTKPTDQPPSGVSRREFVQSAAAGAAAFMIVPRRVLGRGMTAPSDLVNIATIGINGQGGTNTQNVMSQNIVAICDIDDTLLDKRLTGWTNNVAQAAAAAGRQGGAAAGRAGGAAAAGTGRQGGAAPAANIPQYTDFGMSAGQRAANDKWVQAPQAEMTARFVTEQIPKLKRYRDYREMLDKQKDIDGVIVATPDHMHAAIATAAMAAGKHVYVQKPLCWSVQEARYLAKKAADNPKLVTQMGNQGHSLDAARRGQEYLMAGAIGEIREVHVWTNRPLGYWPQGVPRPDALHGDPAGLPWDNNGVETRLANAMAGNYPAPPTLDWELFLGVCDHIDYHPIYHPFNWRGWVHWGQGALGDMGAHLIDHPVWGLKLGLPTTIESVSTPFNGLSYPVGSATYYTFPANGSQPAVKLAWYDGGLFPPKPEEMGEEKMNADGGVLYVGSQGKMLQNTYGARPRLLPAEKHNAYGAPKEMLPRVPHESHEMNWVNAIRGTDEISCPFSYASHLVEIMLLGVVSLRSKTKIQYDGANMKVTNNTPANDLLTRQYRQGWQLS